MTLLAVVFLAIHVGTTIADGYTPIGLKDAFVPFVSAYRPVWLGLGALSCDLLVAVVVTSLLRARFGFRTWRTVHWLAYASWPLALLHSLGTGSDARFGWMAALGLACVGAVTFSVLVRVGSGEGTVRIRAVRRARSADRARRPDRLVRGRPRPARLGGASRDAGHDPPSTRRRRDRADRPDPSCRDFRQRSADD